MRRGDVYDATLDPVVGSEQAGARPVVIVGRDALNATSSVILAVPCTTVRPGRRRLPSHVALDAPDGGLTVDSIALCEQLRALSTVRFRRYRGSLSPTAMARIDAALLIALDLDT